MDVLIPFVDSDDPEWFKIFCTNKHLRIKDPRVLSILFVPFKRRYSSHGLFKYWWRALDNNYKSLGKVHLLLMQESQFPTFLNKDDPRIVVHYHREFLSSFCMPCFNSSTIELCAIKNLDLQGNFILSNDDMYFNSITDDTSFEINGKPKTMVSLMQKPYGIANNFRWALTNGHTLVKNHYGKEIPYYKWHHLFQVYNSSFCKDFLTSEWGVISKGLGKWRSPTDYNHMMLMMAQNICGESVSSNDFPYQGYYDMATFSNDMCKSANTHKVVCFNDSDGVHLGFVKSYLENKYPNKCSFEL